MEYSLARPLRRLETVLSDQFGLRRLRHVTATRDAGSSCPTLQLTGTLLLPSFNQPPAGRGFSRSLQHGLICGNDFADQWMLPWIFDWI